MNRRRRLAPKVLSLALAAASSGAALAADTTADLLTAPVVETITYRYKAGKLEAGYGGKRSGVIEDGGTALASSRIRLVFPDFNPFEVDLVYEAMDEPDPNYEQLKKFTDALAGLGEVLGAKPKGAEGGDIATGAQSKGTCKALQETLDLLEKALQSLDFDQSELKNWRRDALGVSGVRNVAKLIHDRTSKLPAQIASARRIAADIVDMKWTAGRASEQPAKAPEKRDSASKPAAAPTPSAMPSQSPTPKEGATQAGIGGKPGTGTKGEGVGVGKDKKVEGPKKTTPPDPIAACSEMDLQLAKTLVRSQAIESRIQRAETLKRSLDRLETALTEMTKAWEGDSFVIGSPSPSTSMQKKIKVAVRDVTLSLEGDEVQRKVSPKDAASHTFVLRRRKSWSPEVAGGVTMSSVRQPKYGTETVDGKTVVAKIGDDALSYQAAVLLNAVCRCWEDSFFYPMLQFGVSTEKQSPALLFGGGFRFTEPRRLAVSAGATLAWVKDLDTLKVGGPVGGTADIDKDLKQTPVVKLYFALQTTF